jgi:hypothetical protein
MKTIIHLDGDAYALDARKPIHKGMHHPDVEILKRILRRNGFWAGSNSTFFGAETENAVKYFQSTHIDKDGKFLLTDGVVGPKTWWALYNASGPEQQNNIPTPKTEFEERYGMLSITRQVFLDAALKEHYERTHEIPDGSNKGDGVNKLIAGFGPAPWCMLFVSWLHKQATGEWPLGHQHAHVQTFWRDASKAGMTLAKSAVPAPGDCIVWAFPGGSGHIAVVVATSASGKTINTIGGNEGNRVKLGVRYPEQERHVVGYVRLFGDAPSDFPFRLIDKTEAGGMTLADSR